VTARVVHPEANPVATRPLRIAAYAGVCSAFGFLLWRAIVEYVHKQPAEIFDVTLAIVIVAAGVVLFIEPWIDRMKRLFGLPASHAGIQGGNRLLLLVGGAMVIVVASFSHGLLASLIEHNPSGAFGIIIAALLLPGGVTYAWMRGGRHRPRRATLSGLVGGAALGVCFGFAAVFVLVDRSAVSLNEAEIALIASFFPWPLFGLVGGIVIDKGWGRSPSHSVPLAVMGVALALAAIGSEWTVAVFDDLAKVFGWMTGLVLQRSAIESCLGSGTTGGPKGAPSTPQG
jgi:hypothetical protein